MTTASAALPPHWLPALRHSRYLTRQLAARPELAGELAGQWQTVLTRDALRAELDAPPLADDDALKQALRRLRQRVMGQVTLRDLAGAAPLAEVVETMTLLAEVSVNFALDWLHRSLVAQFGEPLDSQGRPQRLLVIGMGKLGGRELNVSSDIDLIFVYPEEGDSAGPKKIEAYDFFTRLGKRLIAAIGELTGDGQVFRVDMRLRPNGDSGPLVLSLDALENYFISQGREWERYAWIKARVLNSGANAQPEHIAALEQVARPFVFRKYLDYGAINAMRDLHVQIRREVARKDMANHIKLGPGGIREIEFIAQVFQLIRGGRDTALQIKPTLKILDLAAERRLLPAETRDELAAAYDFLRRTEHRLQYFEDAQTHALPDNDNDRQILAESLGLADYPAFLAELDGHRARVSRHFEAVFADPGDAPHCDAGLWLDQLDEDMAVQCLTELGYTQPASVVAHLRRFRSSARYQQLPATNRERLDALGPRLIDAAAETAVPEVTLERALAFLEAICRRGAYLALLQQYPTALKKVAELFGSSLWATDYLIRHPIVIDELLDPRLLDTATDWSAYRSELDRRLAESAGDDEREMDILREMHHAQLFRILVQDLAGLHSLEHISDHLTELADITVAAVLRLCWGKLRTRHRPAGEPPRFAVIGYGKLGGKELGYASDLDLVFVFDDPDPAAGEIYARLAQRMNTWLSSQTAAGILFETDLRLRPNGDSGLLVNSIDAFRDYQLQHAWVWEHQALTRARFCAGDPAVGARFEAIRTEILRQPRDLAKLREEVLAMRQKMLDSHGAENAEAFDIKQDPGGIIDVEFIVQYLILGYAQQHPELCGNLGNIALLGIAADLGLISRAHADPVRDAYREFRRLQHAKRLNGSPQARIPRALVGELIAAVRTLWDAVFN